MALWPEVVRKAGDGAGLTDGHRPQPNVTWITSDRNPAREIDSDTRPFRIDRSGIRKLSRSGQHRNRPAPSRFRRQASSDPERDTLDSQTIHRRRWVIL